MPRRRVLTFCKLVHTGAWYLKDEELDYPPGMWVDMYLSIVERSNGDGVGL